LPCTSKCERLLICGHACESSCGVPCQPCTKRKCLFQPCHHVRCKSKCEDPCTTPCKVMKYLDKIFELHLFVLGMHKVLKTGVNTNNLRFSSFSTFPVRLDSFCCILFKKSIYYKTTLHSTKN